MFADRFFAVLAYGREQMVVNHTTRFEDRSTHLKEFAHNQTQLDENVYLAEDMKVERRYWLVCWSNESIAGEGVCYFGEQLFQRFIDEIIGATKSHRKECHVGTGCRFVKHCKTLGLKRCVF